MCAHPKYSLLHLLLFLHTLPECDGGSNVGKCHEHTGHKEDGHKNVDINSPLLGEFGPCYSALGVLV